MNRATPVVAIAALALLLTLLPVSSRVDVAQAGQLNGTGSGQINGESSSQDQGDPDDLDAPSPPNAKFLTDSVPPGGNAQAVSLMPHVGSVAGEESCADDAAWQVQVALRLLSILF